MNYKPAGGPKSKNVTHPRVRTGTGSHSTRPAGTNKFGYAVGDHVTNRPGGTGYRGERLHNPERNFQPVKFGNEVALNVGGGGPGKGRSLYGQSGSQGCHGAANPGSPRPNTQRNALEQE